jgi:hypothetical protein
MSHTKHSNTFFPGDRVRVTGGAPGKTASNEEGIARAVHPTGGSIYVQFPDGRREIVEVENLEKVE